MNILITGVAGFIGFSIADFLLKNKKNTIFGIDNFDKYYSIKYKKFRINHLQKKSNFKFSKIDISNKTHVENFFVKKKFDVILHFAAQAGVRYSLINPKKYIKVNKVGFENILNTIVKNHIPQKIIYASSSSVYGNVKKLPTKETDKLKPKNIYAKTKVDNEKLAKKFRKNFNLNILGLRFFTMYGEWGRPDMFLFKLLKTIVKKNRFLLNNYGNHKRDFTYIGDVKLIIKKLIQLKKFDIDVLNICGSNPVNIKSVFNENLKKYKITNYEFIKKNKADVLNTHGCNKLLKKVTNFKKFTSFKIGFDKTKKWYFKNNVHKF